MNDDPIAARLDGLMHERNKAQEELGALRQRIQYLETMLLRIDGAMTVLNELTHELQYRERGAREEEEDADLPKLYRED